MASGCGIDGRNSAMIASRTATASRSRGALARGITDLRRKRERGLYRQNPHSNVAKSAS